MTRFASDICAMIVEPRCPLSKSIFDLTLKETEGGSSQDPNAYMALQITINDLEDVPLSDMGDMVDYNYFDKDDHHSASGSKEGELSKNVLNLEDIGGNPIDQDEATSFAPPPITEGNELKDKVDGEIAASSMVSKPRDFIVEMKMTEVIPTPEAVKAQDKGGVGNHMKVSSVDHAISDITMTIIPPSIEKEHTI